MRNLPDTDENPGLGPVLTDSDFLVSACSLGEYRSRFTLTDKDLTGRILDCPGGAASVVAEICGAGGTAIAVDPEYGRPPDLLIDRVRDDETREFDYTDRTAAGYDWDLHGGTAGHRWARQRSAESFLADRQAHPERYATGELPALPFEDGEFDLALCSHLLFTYADRFDADFHVASVVELARVAREARIYPLVDHEGTPLPELVGRVIAGAEAAGLSCVIEPVSRPFQRAATTRLVVRH